MTFRFLERYRRLDCQPLIRLFQVIDESVIATIDHCHHVLFAVHCDAGDFFSVLDGLRVGSVRSGVRDLNETIAASGGKVFPIWAHRQYCDARLRIVRHWQHCLVPHLPIPDHSISTDGQNAVVLQEKRIFDDVPVQHGGQFGCPLFVSHMRVVWSELELSNRESS